MIDFTNHAMIWMFSAAFMVLAFITMLRLKEKPASPANPTPQLIHD
jgi:hypothetical protein